MVTVLGSVVGVRAFTRYRDNALRIQVASCLRQATLASTRYAPSDPDAEVKIWQQLKEGGCVLVMRHALKQSGDEPNLVIDDRATQVNLSPEGVAQAKAVGQQIKSHDVPIGQVLSSPYFRCRDTAEATFGSVEVNQSLVALPADERLADRQTAAMRQLVTGWKGPKNLAVVTHSPNIKALTGVELPMGGLVVLKPTRENFEVVGTLLPDDSTREAK